MTMNVEFCEDNSGASKKMRYFRKNKVGARTPPLDPSLYQLDSYSTTQCSPQWEKGCRTYSRREVDNFILLVCISKDEFR